MHMQRRNALAKLKERAEALDAALARHAEEAGAIRDDLDTLMSEEQEAFDALPASLQEGARGQDMQTAIEAMQEAYDALDALATVLEESELHGIVETKLDEARGAE